MTLVTVYYSIAIASGAIGLAIILWKLLLRLLTRVRRNERERVWEHVRESFVADMARNHLPHIYDALKMLARERGITLGEPPPIRFMVPEAEPRDYPAAS